MPSSFVFAFVHVALLADVNFFGFSQGDFQDKTDNL